MVNCGPGVIVAGSEPPAMSVMYADPRGAFSGYSVIFSELDPDDPDDETLTNGRLPALPDPGRGRAVGVRARLGARAWTGRLRS